MDDGKASEEIHIMTQVTSVSFLDALIGRAGQTDWYPVCDFVATQAISSLSDSTHFDFNGQSLVLNRRALFPFAGTFVGIFIWNGSAWYRDPSFVTKKNYTVRCAESEGSPVYLQTAADDASPSVWIKVQGDLAVDASKFWRQKSDGSAPEGIVRDNYDTPENHGVDYNNATAAINAITAAGGHCRLLRGATYICHAASNGAHHAVIMAPGAKLDTNGATIKLANSQPDCRLIATSTYDQLTGAVDNIEIVGAGTIDGNQANQTMSNFAPTVDLTNITNSYFDGFTVQNGHWAAIYEYTPNGYGGNRFGKIKVTSSNGVGIMLRGDQPISIGDIEANNCKYVDVNGSGSPFMILGCAGTTINSITAYNFGWPVKLILTPNITINTVSLKAGPLNTSSGNEDPESASLMQTEGAFDGTPTGQELVHIGQLICENAPAQGLIVYNTRNCVIDKVTCREGGKVGFPPSGADSCHADVAVFSSQLSIGQLISLNPTGRSIHATTGVVKSVVKVGRQDVQSDNGAQTYVNFEYDSDISIGEAYIHRTNLPTFDSTYFAYLLQGGSFRCGYCRYETDAGWFESGAARKSIVYDPSKAGARIDNLELVGYEPIKLVTLDASATSTHVADAAVWHSMMSNESRLIRVEPIGSAATALGPISYELRESADGRGYDLLHPNSGSTPCYFQIEHGPLVTKYARPFNFLGILGCKCLLLPGNGITTDVGTGKVTRWEDASGNGAFAVPADLAHAAPYHESGGPNNLPYLQFGLGGVFTEYSFPEHSFDGLAAVTAYVLLQLDHDPPVAGGGCLWSLTADPNNEALVPYTSGNIYDNFGSTARKTTGTSTAGAMTSPTVYAVKSGAGNWTNYLNGTQFYTTATNTYGMSSTQLLLGVNINRTYWTTGKIVAFALFDGSHTDPQRGVVDGYLKALAGIT
jgi:hypothetical protein